MLAGPPQLYHGHEELKRTVEEDFPEVTADLEASLKTNVLSFVEAGCCWRLLCTLSPLLPFPHFTPSTFAARINIPWVPRGNKQLVWRRGLEFMARKHSLSLQRKAAPSFYCQISTDDWAKWGIYSSLAGLPS